MMEFIKALVMISAMVACTSYLLNRTEQFFAVDHHRLLMVWFSFIVIAYITPFFWGYIFACGVLAAAVPGLIKERSFVPLAQRKASNAPGVNEFFGREARVILFCASFLMLPDFEKDIPGLVVNKFITMNGMKTILLVSVLPLFFMNPKVERKDRKKKQPGQGADFLITLFFILVCILEFRGTTFTHGLRKCVEIFIFMILPYYAVSRHLKTINGLRSAMFAFALPVAVLGLFAVYSMIDSWHPYFTLANKWGIYSYETTYLFRAGLLRAFLSLTTAGSIGLGILSVVSMLFMWGLLTSAKDMNKKIFKYSWIILLFMMLTVLTTLSRGPWLCGIIGVVVFIALGRNVLSRLLKMGMIGFIGFLAVLPTSFGQKLVSLIPFIGSENADDTLGYRQRLLEAAQTVIARHPVFGDTNYIEAPEMQALKVGWLIIDIVNSYLQYALEYGLVGLGLVGLLFLTALFGVIKTVRKLRHDVTGVLPLGQAIVAGYVAFLVCISSMSLIGIVPEMLFMLTGFCIAYQRIVADMPELSDATGHNSRQSGQGRSGQGRPRQSQSRKAHRHKGPRHRRSATATPPRASALPESGD